MNKKRLSSFDFSSIDINDKKAMQDVASGLLAKMKKEKKSLKEVIDLDDAFLEKIYSYAYTHYNAGKYQQALQLFEFLIQVSPKTYKYVLGCGACLYQMKLFAVASFLFYSALNLDPTNAYTAYYLTDSLIKNGHIEEAKEALDITIDIARAKEEYAHIKERCYLLKQGL